MANRTRFNRLVLLCFCMMGLIAETAQSQQPQETEATRALKARSEQLQPTVTRASDSVYCASGYSPANIAMIVGTDGLIIIDTGMFPAHAEQVLAEFRKITDLPVVAVILTHGHGDHTGGLSVFTRAGGADSDVPVYARTPFNTEADDFSDAGITINRLRGARQGGFLLPPERRINNGIAPAVYPPKDRNVFAGGPVEPTVTFSHGRKKIALAGIECELVAAPGETSDQHYVWFPAERVVFTGDNFYRSWPNLYAIRGTGYRDVKQWIHSLDMMLAEKPLHAVPGHTLPLIGEERTVEVLTNYRNAIQHVFDATIEGINQGLTPDELVQRVKLPPELASKDYLREFYGNVEWGVRAIFSGTIGWFDGNPTNLFSLPPAEEAKQMASLAGGKEQLAARAQQAFDEGDAQWCAQLCDHLIAHDPKASEPKLLKAEALEALADNLITATGRNYYLTVAQELRRKAIPERGVHSGTPHPASDATNTGDWILNREISDEFEGRELDASKWLVQGTAGEYRSQFIGRAPSQFSTRNVRVEDGKLKLQTRWEPDFPFFEKPDRDGRKYENITTAAVISKNQFVYGYMEIKCKAADASVTSSFWMTGHRSELDVFEFMGEPAQANKKHLEREYMFTMIDWSKGQLSRVWRGTHQLGWRVADGFHVYGCEWNQDYLNFYADGKLVGGATKAELGARWVLKNPLWIWVDSETFPWHGLPPKEDLPVDFEIEYIRVWQQEHLHE